MYSFYFHLYNVDDSTNDAKERNQTSLFMTKKVREVHLREEDKLRAGEAVLKCCDNSFVKGGRGV